MYAMYKVILNHNQAIFVKLENTIMCVYIYTHIHIHTHIYGEGNDNPLQYSCLENSMDGGAW